LISGQAEAAGDGFDAGFSEMAISPNILLESFYKPSVMV
jgi:hypothetical protein